MGTYINFAPSKTPQNRCNGEQKRTTFDEKGARNDQKEASFALHILTQEAPIAPGGPETQIRTPKNAHLGVLAK